MSDAAETWASILHFARTAKSYDKATPNIDATIYAGDRIAELEKQLDISARNGQELYKLRKLAQDAVMKAEWPRRTEVLSELADFLEETK